MSHLPRTRRWGYAGECLCPVTMAETTADPGAGAPIFGRHVLGGKWRHPLCVLLPLLVALGHWQPLERPGSLGQPGLEMESSLSRPPFFSPFSPFLHLSPPPSTSHSLLLHSSPLFFLLPSSFPPSTTSFSSLCPFSLPSAILSPPLSSTSLLLLQNSRKSRPVPTLYMANVPWLVWHP